MFYVFAVFYVVVTGSMHLIFQSI